MMLSIQIAIAIGLYLLVGLALVIAVRPKAGRRERRG